MIQDALDHRGLGDEAHDPHLASAARTDEGVDFDAHN
jgi:tRNA U38,U39,U40 pseudouridine synthase TruA